MPFIVIKRTEKAVEVVLECGRDDMGAPLQGVRLTWNANDDLFAGLLAEKLRAQLFETVKKIREQAYEAGWKDAKSKKFAKADYQSGYLS